MNRLVIIDGNAVLHRAYHAIPPLTAPDGSVVNAVYGFATMLLRLNTDLRPTHIAVVFDRPAPTFRKKIYKEYQATRPKMDEALVGQIEKVHELVRAFNIPIFEKDGFEADDLIGTLTERAEDSDIDQTIVVTGDRDILQLVDKKTYVYMPTKGLSEAKLYMDGDVKERMGVDAKHITDYKGLAGDASDNYPGVDGIGPKTAISLIEIFGSVEGVYKAVKKHDPKMKSFSPSVVGKLEKGEKNARLSKELATIRRDIDMGEKMNDMKVTSLDTPKVREFFDRMHFHSLLKRLSGEVDRKAKEPKKPKEKKVKTESGQQQLF